MNKVGIIFSVLIAFPISAGCGGDESDSNPDLRAQKLSTRPEPFADVEIAPEVEAEAQSFEAQPEYNSRGGDYPYSSFGPYGTSTTNYSSGKGYLVYHPRDLDSVEGKMPIVTWGNPSFFDSWVFYKLLHLVASQGFVVVASHDVSTGSGEEMRGGIDLMLSENEDPKSPFYQRLATDRIGAFGHSQGGMGTVAAVEADPRISTTVPIDPGIDVVVSSSYEPKAGHNGPMLIFTGQFDPFSPPNYVERKVYDVQLDTTVFGVKKGMSHYGPVSALGGDNAIEHYTVAWFLLHLKNRSDLQSEFFGSGCHLCDDSDFKVQSK